MLIERSEFEVVDTFEDVCGEVQVIGGVTIGVCKERGEA